MRNGKTPKPKKPIYKRIWFWIVVVILSCVHPDFGFSEELDEALELLEDLEAAVDLCF